MRGGAFSSRGLLKARSRERILKGEIGLEVVESLFEEVLVFYLAEYMHSTFKSDLGRHLRPSLYLYTTAQS
jgi:hypothetical protein